MRKRLSIMCLNWIAAVLCYQVKTFIFSKFMC